MDGERRTEKRRNGEKEKRRKGDGEMRNGDGDLGEWYMRPEKRDVGRRW